MGDFFHAMSLKIIFSVFLEQNTIKTDGPFVPRARQLVCQFPCFDAASRYSFHSFFIGFSCLWISPK
jgi:hypothetical protein